MSEFLPLYISSLYIMQRLVVIEENTNGETLSIYPSIHLSIYPSVRPSVCMYVSRFTNFSKIHSIELNNPLYILLHKSFT